ncbi:helix-turn-helix domain-containing protein [Nocardia terpenica]|uniref:helix-turn-helix domain-containing protein n=1 Tax=Nocardia terpenica TaxID=455432 RepID=UPI003A5BC10C
MCGAAGVDAGRRVLRYTVWVRYAQGGGLTVERRKARKRLRFDTARSFAGGEANAEIARRLRVTVRSVQRWRRAWLAGGESGLRSKGSGIVACSVRCRVHGARG